MPKQVREAQHYKQITPAKVQCTLCPHNCLLQMGERSRCRSRENIDGKLIATNYAECAGIAIDRIEKKPLYHFRPGSKILSLGANSCNLSCSFCQNYSISQLESSTRYLPLSDLYAMVMQQSTKQVAFTYTEPFTWYEYILDFAMCYPEIDIIIISNGFINPQALKEIIPYIAAFNIDLKGYDAAFYTDFCDATLQPVLDSIAMIYESGKHLEITNLLIPGPNSSMEAVTKLAQFIASISKEIPLHISAYHPDYMMDKPATTQADIETAIRIANKQLLYVYGGNLPISDLSNTVCPICKNMLIKRDYNQVYSSLDSSACCPKCGCKIYGVY